MYGLTIKIWNSEYNEKQDIFKIDDILVLLWTEICSSDLPHLSTIVKNLVGNENIDSLVNERLSSIKSEPIEDDFLPAEDLLLNLHPLQQPLAQYFPA